MDARGSMIEQILRQAKRLPLKAQWELCLLIQNLDVIEEWACDPMTFEEKERYVSDALQRKDYLLAMVVEYKWLKQECEKE